MIDLAIMDMQTPLIFVGLFVLASILLTIIYKLGIKEKSYEEALAEQRLQNQILLGTSKSKEKKVKKPSKKIKQKASSVENEIVEDNASNAEVAQEDSTTDVQKKPHVEFKDDAEEVTIKSTVSKKQSKKEKVKPILVQKGKNDDSVNSVNDTEAVSTANQFEESHPKDDFELLRSNTATGEDLIKEEPEKASKHQKLETTNKKHNETVVPVQKEKSSPTAHAAGGPIGNTGKEKKKKKSEFNTLQQLAASDSDGPNMSVLLNLVRKAELSRSEVQILIDLLLNKQHEAPAQLDEWSEGKSDPVQKLKKQLAEKERLWMEEKELAASTQNKLREIRSEFQSEKSQLQQKIRGFEEAFHSKQLELNHVQQTYVQAQNQLKDEMIKNHKMHEELSAMQMQRQQIEMHLAQTQESDVHIAQLKQELSSLSNKMNIELKRKNEEILLEKERGQACIMQLQQELEQYAERSRQSEEALMERERVIEKLLKQESEYKSENIHFNTTLQQLNEEIRRLEHSKKQSIDEVQDLNKLVNQLKTDVQKLHDEKANLQTTHVNGSMLESKQHQIEILNLHNLISSLKTQLVQTQEESDSKLKNATALSDKLKVELEQEQSKVEEQKQKNNELRTKNWKVMDALNAAESRIKTNKKPNNDIEKEFLQRLFPEIKELANIKTENFQAESEKYIRNFIKELKEQKAEEEIVGESDNVEVYQLKSQLQHYRDVIDKTEKILTSLQNHIEEEELKWRMQLAQKNTEIEAIRDQLREKLTNLENELEAVKEEKHQIFTELQKFKNS